MNSHILAQIGQGVVGTGNTGSQSTLNNMMGNIFTYIFLAGGLFMFYQLILGALNWINSQGEKERLVKAQKQLQNALIGFVLLFVVFVVFIMLIQVFGFATFDSNGLTFGLPSLMAAPTP